MQLHGLISDWWSFHWTAQMARVKLFLLSQSHLIMVALSAFTSAPCLRGRFRPADGSSSWLRMDHVSKSFLSRSQTASLSNFLSGSVQPVICDVKNNAFDFLKTDSSVSITDVYHNKVLGVRTAPNMPPTVLKCDLNIANDFVLCDRVQFKRPAEKVWSDRWWICQNILHPR